MDNLIIVNAMQLYAISQYQAKSDVRYYLNGTAIYPNRREVVATNGHTMCVASYEEDQFLWEKKQGEKNTTDEKHWILGDPTGSSKGINLKKPKADEIWAVIQLDEDTKRGVVQYTTYENIDAIRAALREKMLPVSQVFSFMLIDGTFPKYRNIKPNYDQPLENTCMTLFPEYVLMAAKTAQLMSRKSGMTFHYPINEGVCLEINIGGCPEIVIIIMQMRSSEVGKGFLPNSLKAKALKEEAA